MDIAPYKLADEQFWATEERGEDALAREPVGDYRGILVDAPSRVDISQRSTLPFGIYHLGSIREMAAIQLDRLGVVTAMSITENRLYVAAGSALVKDTDLIDAELPDPASLPDGDMSTTYSAEGRELLSLPWTPGRYLVTVLLRDVVSNRPVVELFDPAVSPQQLDGAGLPSNVELTLQPRRVVDLSHTWRWPVRGSFSLPNFPEDPTKRALPEEPVATVVMFLLIVGADDGSVDVVRLRVAAYERYEHAVTGSFSVDLLQLISVRKPQTYFISAFCGEAMAGPLPSALLAPEQSL